MAIRHLLADCVLSRCAETCPAVQDAIDRFASEFCGRSGLVDALRGPNFPDSSVWPLGCRNLGEQFGVARDWLDERTVLLATGKSRADWLDAIDRFGHIDAENFKQRYAVRLVESAKEFASLFEK